VNKAVFLVGEGEAIIEGDGVVDAVVNITANPCNYFEVQFGPIPTKRFQS